MTKTDDNFMMLPTVDFCFKELMQNPKVRKGFIAALMEKKPEEIEETTLLPTILRQEYEEEEPYHTIVFCDQKTGKTYTDLLELKILELRKIQGMESREDIIRWMRFFSGKSREEFEQMAREDEYLEEAYDTLKKLSADERKRLEYEAREKALRDYNSQMSSMLKRGEKRGEEIGKKRGEEIGKAQINQLNKLLAEQGRIDDIIKAAQEPEYQMELLKEFRLQTE